MTTAIFLVNLIGWTFLLVQRSQQADEPSITKGIRFASNVGKLMLVIIIALIAVGLIGRWLAKDDARTGKSMGDYIFMIKVQYACFGAAAMGLLALYAGNPHVGVW